MQRIVLGLLTSLLFLSSPALATPCTSFPYPLTNGTTADASQVMANYTYLSGCLAPLASPSFTGDVGIGTASPAYLLQAYSTDANSGINLTNNSSGGSTSYYPGISVTNYMGTGTGQGVFALLNAAGTAASPAAIPAGTFLGEMLSQGYNGSGFAEGARIAFRAGQTWSGSTQATDLYFNTTHHGAISETSDMVIVNGQVGIGTTAPATNLTVFGSGAKILAGNTSSGYSAGQGGALQLSNYYSYDSLELNNGINADPTDNSTGMYSTFGGGSSFPWTLYGVVVIYGRNDPVQGWIDFRTGNGGASLSDRMVISPAGLVGIGTTSPSQSLEVNGMVKVDSFASASATAVCQNAGVLSSCSSSLRYKENVENAPFGLNEIMAMRPVTFKWRGRDENDIGLIAEEVEKINPLFVTRKDGHVEGVKYAQLSAVLAKAVQEQQAQIVALKADNARLATAMARATAALDSQGRQSAEVSKENVALRAAVAREDRRLDTLEAKIGVHSASRATLSIYANNERNTQ